MIAKQEKKQLAVLSILEASDKPLSGLKITEELLALGREISERTVRLYLKKMNQDGLAQSIGKRGRQITERGLGELEFSRTVERVEAIVSADSTLWRFLRRQGFVLIRGQWLD